ncbi:TPA: hypothetical protein U3R41_001467 [Streptococcus agalactiae]|nr:hypothetical protein [Streptococcus agalactiae]HEN0823852.1 hypothetical protein [Streptococcus agalactiae]HEN0937551.1 hypothetical protein [Streptococcus agalactiae]
MINLTLEGEHELLSALKKEVTFENKRKAVRKHGTKMHSKAINKASFRGHYEGKKFVKPTGATRRSIKLEFSNQSTVAKVKAGTNYSGYLETGTRLMEEQPFMKPALDSVIDNFIKDLARVE